MNKNPIVIQLIDSLNSGGAEMMAVNIANGLAEKGVVSHICTTRLEGDLKSKIVNSVGYLFLNKKSALDFSAIKKLYNYIKLHNIQIIHAHSSSYFTAFLIKILIPTIKIVWQDHYGNSENLKNRNKFPLNGISKNFNSIISVNLVLKEWAKTYLKCKEVYFIPNFASFGTITSKITFLKGEENKKIVCLANLRPQKDHITLLKSFLIVHKKHLDWTLHIVGIDLKDKYSEKIKLYIKDNKLSNHVFLYGSCSDTRFILEQATIGVLSSKSEGLPVALLEYGLSKLPVVVTNVGECGKVVTNTVNGLVIEPNNKNELAKGVLKLIENSNLGIKYGKNLYNEIQLNYSKENYIKQLLSIYKSE
ncbi:glycosyltransferase family 4 protein [Lutibacter sp.]